MDDIDIEKIRKLDGSLLLIFRELLRQRRTTVAADRLGLSQSAVSHALARLRALFDDPLFVRRPHGLEPTPRAIALGPRIDALVGAMGDVLGIADAFDPTTAGHDFRIGAPDHLATLLAPDLLQEFRDRAPRSRFSFSQHLGDAALDALRRHEADVVLGRFRTRIPRSFDVETLFVDRYCLIARAQHPQIDGDLTATHYEELDHILVSVSGDFRTLDIESADARSRVRRPVAAVPRFAMAVPLVATSDAVAVVPRRLALQIGPAFGVVAHELPMEVERIEVLMVRRHRPDGAIDWLVQVLRGLDASSASPAP